MVKRFNIETNKTDTIYPFITEASKSKVYFASTAPNPILYYSYKSDGNKKEENLDLAEFIDVKGWKANGNKIGEFKVLKVRHTNPVELKEETDHKQKIENKDLFSDSEPKKTDKIDDSSNNQFKAGDTIDLDL